jgi:hypothetical protein
LQSYREARTEKNQEGERAHRSLFGSDGSDSELADPISPSNVRERNGTGGVKGEEAKRH